MALLIAHSTVLGYQPGEVFEVDLDDPAVVEVLDPYLAGKQVGHYTGPGDPVLGHEPTSGELKVETIDPTDRAAFPNIEALTTFADANGLELAGATTRPEIEAAIVDGLAAPRS